ncbi:peptidoglycan -binding protein [Paracoccus fistulariae]|uniref:Peptidoglycan -binding protein n=1 Tax=Paracoccus fistulariae TaxID=658446 RepID=A0ABY7SJP7_9RHOB|nr:peptidoglycan -binding protein [Paracoccus fistulariae]MDB6180526.1 peptidoglycan -binding protein [Paracoccus fistulariae]WCR07229.1 peptidoglycan -binding protein [Paracoccus fistulariae]
MALSRGSGNRFSSSIWPGYVDAMTTLLMVLMFVLTIFMVAQAVLREQLDTQDDTIADQGQQLSQQEQRLQDLGQQISSLGQALSASRDREADLQGDVAAEAARAREAEAEARDRAARITRLNTQLQSTQEDLSQARSQLTDFEAEVAALMAARAADLVKATSEREDLQAQVTAQQDRASVAELAVAAARQEIDAQQEQARLAAARREAMEALIADLRSRNEATEARNTDLQAQLTEAEAARLTDAEAAALLRERLERADSELTAMTLSLEESRKRAEETLTLLAAAEAARDDASDQAAKNLSEAQRQAILLQQAKAALADQENLSDEGQRRVALLNEQVASLTARLGSLQALLDAAGDEQEQAELRVEDLGQQLNAALLRAAEEKDRRLALEEEARLKAEEEARDLARYRSEFFGRLSQILQGRQGVQVVGDRFVFQSEVLFAPGEATLSSAGRREIAGIAELLDEIAGDIPPEIDWIIRVDGHTDSTPLSGTGRYRDNWELSQARALAVVRYMTDDLGFPANRVAATGFADTRPVDVGNDPEALARNRRIELKLTER